LKDGVLIKVGQIGCHAVGKGKKSDKEAKERGKRWRREKTYAYRMGQAAEFETVNFS
jgi:hypothetical protein